MTGTVRKQVKFSVDRYLPGYNRWRDGIKAGMYTRQRKG